MSIAELINGAQFDDLFIDELGWNVPRNLREQSLVIEGEPYAVRPVADYKALSVWVCDQLLSPYIQRRVHKALTETATEHLLIFHDRERQVWVWPESTKRRGSQTRLTPQRHLVGDHNLQLEQRLGRLRVTIGQDVPVVDMLRGIQDAFDADAEAAVRIGDLHDHLLEDGFGGRDLEVFLTRLLFCFFGDDSALFGDDGQLYELLERSSPAGEDLRGMFEGLFDVLNTPENERTGVAAELSSFAYVNGGLFRVPSAVPDFNVASRRLLLLCSQIDWSGISPAIFGAMFQGLLEGTVEHLVDASVDRRASRRALGAHYTSEPNILRVINPLFLDGLRNELAAGDGDASALEALHTKIARLTFLDPACGCGNFLVVAYQQLRLLEMDILEQLIALPGSRFKSGETAAMSVVNVDQFFGIEISVSASNIATVALWITDHQMNSESLRRFGVARPSVPLESSPFIVQENALTYSWDLVLPATDCDYVMGNPPFVGKQYQSADQKSDLAIAFRIGKTAALRGAGVLDYVTGWFVKAVDYIERSGSSTVAELDIFAADESGWGGADKARELPDRLHGSQGVSVGLVATNSITQGEQVGVLWPWVLSRGIKITYAHRSFQWSNEAPGVAQVQCVIIGLSKTPADRRRLYDYSLDPRGEPVEVEAANINPYLLDAPDVVASIERKPLPGARPLVWGNMPNDDGHLILSEDEMAALRASEPEIATAHVRLFWGSRELIQSRPRYCLWLVGASESDIAASPFLSAHVELVREARRKSKRPATIALARKPHLFGEIRQKPGPYIAIPEVSSERRRFVPIALLDDNVVASNKLYMMPDGGLFEFGILNSTMHNAWVRIVSGRLENRIQYSAGIVYNNFAWPTGSAHEGEVRGRAQAVLDARSAHQGWSLAQLYGSDAMPADLELAHAELDLAVDAAYGYAGDGHDAGRAELLFKMLKEARERAGRSR